MYQSTSDEDSTQPEDAVERSSEEIRLSSASSHMIAENETWIDITETFTRCAQGRVFVG